jgi:hypothetical protein
MKKQKFTKQQAHVGNPALLNSFSAPASHAGELSIVFKGKNAKIHGYDGSSWSLIYTWNNVDSQFTTDNTYQNYYIESLTGSQEMFGVSFFSVNKIQNSNLRLPTTHAESKLHDIDEVPVYTASDVDKMLTIMSDGSLRWLLADETYMIDGSPPPSGPNFTVNGDAVNNGGLMETNGGYFSALWSDFVSYTGNTPDNTDFTVSFWWKHGETPVTGLTPQFGLFNGRTAAMNQGMTFYIKDHWSSGIRLQTNFGPSYFAGRQNLVSEDPNVPHPWNHFVITRTATATKTFWNGVQVASHGANFPFVPTSATAEIQIGATNDGGSDSAYNTLFDNFEIRDGEAMSPGDITTLYNQGR